MVLRQALSASDTSVRHESKNHTKELLRSQQRAIKGLISLQKLDADYTRQQSAAAALSAAKSQVMEAQAAIEGAGFDIVWPDFLATAVIGAVFFGGALARFRKTIAAMQT